VRPRAKETARMPPIPKPRPTPPPSTPADALRPFWATVDGPTPLVSLYHGNVTDVLARLPEKSVHCCVTSPPYWGLRDYGTGTWEGGDRACDHLKPPVAYIGKKSTLMTDGRANPGHQDGHKYTSGTEQFKGTCGKCGATRVDRQLGSEPSPDCGTQGKAQCGRCFVCSMVAVFRGVRRVLRDDGTLWLNLGDSYAGNAVGHNPDAPSNVRRREEGNHVEGNFSVASQRIHDRQTGQRNTAAASGLKSGNLVGVPWRVALALQADGWVLRQDIVWHKPAPMPESVRNRCTKAHEYVFLLTKGMRYFCDMEAIKERSKDPGSYKPRTARSADKREDDPLFATKVGNHAEGMTYPLSNKRSVWSVVPGGYAGAHFATFPPKLIEPMIKAGTSERGCCRECGAPFRRLLEERGLVRDRPNALTKRTGEDGTGNVCPNDVAGVETRTVGWEPSCTCFGRFEKRVGAMPKSNNRYTGGDRNAPGDSGASVRGGGVVERIAEIYVPTDPDAEHPVVPCTVLDPFVGSGTTCCVAAALGRRSVGVDLNEAYLRDNAVVRVEGELGGRPDLARVLPSRANRKAVAVGRPVAGAGVGVGASGGVDGRSGKV
jgi:DNA modification methylase